LQKFFSFKAFHDALKRHLWEDIECQRSISTTHIGPHRILIAIGIGEVETTAARESENGFQDGPMGSLDLDLRLFQIVTVKNNQDTARICSGRSVGPVKAAIDTLV